MLMKSTPEVPLRVVCLTNPAQRRYHWVSEAMIEGIGRCGDRPYRHSVNSSPLHGMDVAVCYGWKRRASYLGYPKFVYADIGHWNRETHYRLAVGAWSPESYVRAGLPSTRLASLGVNIQPVKRGGNTIIVAGSTMKSCITHGTVFQQWETEVCERLKDCGKRVLYRPKPNDPFNKQIRGVEYDLKPIEESLAKASALVTHHSNAAIEALTYGIPVHCETGAAAAFSVPLSEIATAEMPEGREQFLADVAWLNWSLDEMRSGEAWMHLKDRGLVC